jgi:16S rRNA (adenine1518-N6/adenine1519-N6)-dimethyltransferase
MVQREVADRIVARPGTAEYGVLSVLLQWRAEATKLLTIPPGAFRPPPEVQSALVRLRFRPPVVQVRDAVIFEEMVRSMFTRRRKTLANALAAFAAGAGTDTRAVLSAAGIDAGRRPETLEVVEIARLADAFAAAER